MEELLIYPESGTYPRSMLECSTQGGGDVKLGRSPGWNLARAERSRLRIYAFVEGQRKDQEINDQINPIANIHNDSTLFSSISSVKE